MPEKVLQLDERDNAVVALVTLQPGTAVQFGLPSSPFTCTVTETIPAKHKMALAGFCKPGDFDPHLRDGGGRGDATHPSRRPLIYTQRAPSRRKLFHGPPAPRRLPCRMLRPGRSADFLGFHRADGQVGTRNYWLVLPLVFCENRNVERMREALEEELGYGGANSYRRHVRQLIEQHANGHVVAGSRCGIRARSGCFPISMAFASSPTRADAAAPGRMHRRCADCWPATFIIPTWPAPQCLAWAASTPRRHADGRVSRARPQNDQAGAGVRAPARRARHGADEPKRWRQTFAALEQANRPSGHRSRSRG